nr:hypothetical protein [uncultured Allomuricauda sp.]
MTREAYAKELITDFGKTDAIKSLIKDIESLKRRTGCRKLLSFFSDTLEIVRTN